MIGGRKKLSAAPNEGQMFVVSLAGRALGSGLGPSGVFAGRSGRGDKLYFADELGAPSLIDPGAKLARHGLKLAFPVLAVSRDLQAAGLAAERSRMGRQHLADNRWPGAREPGDYRFGALHPPDSAAQKISGLVHGEPDSITAWRAREVTKDQGKK